MLIALNSACNALSRQVKMSVYVAYVNAVGSIAFCVVVLIYVLFQGSSLASNIWLSEWTDDPTLANASLAGTNTYNNLNAMYLGVYGGLGVAQGRRLLIKHPLNPLTSSITCLG